MTMMIVPPSLRKAPLLSAVPLQRQQTGKMRIRRPKGPEDRRDRKRTDSLFLGGGWSDSGRQRADTGGVHVHGGCGAVFHREAGRPVD